MIITKILKVSNYPSNMGLYLEEIPNNNDDIFNDAGDGTLIAHDLLEHSDLKLIGTVDDELKAIGAMRYVRGDYLYKNQNRCPLEILANDIYSLYEDYLDKGIKEKPQTKYLKCEQLDILKEIIEITKKKLNSYSQNYAEDINEKDYINIEKKYLQYSLAYLCNGYNIAKRKYKNRYMHNTFWRIANAIQEINNTDIEIYDIFELKYDYREYCKWRKLET